LYCFVLFLFFVFSSCMQMIDARTSTCVHTHTHTHMLSSSLN
jgi:hypothetical protein